MPSAPDSLSTHVDVAPVTGFGGGMPERRRTSSSNTALDCRVPPMTIGIIMVIRDAWRSLRSAPGTTAFSVIILTAGIAAATITFSVVDAVILRSLPFEDSDRLVVVGPDRPFMRSYSSADFIAWQDRADAFTALAGTAVGPMAHVTSPRHGRM
jgi:hypothetical protein